MTVTDLRIDRRRLDVVQHSASASLRRITDRGWSLGGSVGVLAGGELTFDGRRHVYRPGGAVSFSASRQVLGDDAGNLFLTMSYAAALTVAPTRSPFERPGLYGAVDFSAAFAAGTTVGNVWSPYLAARVFGGPVWFTPLGGLQPGHDPDHHGVGLGSVFTLPGNFEVGVDVVVAGARGITAQAGFGF